jgi:hypothetical protein
MSKEKTPPGPLARAAPEAPRNPKKNHHLSTLPGHCHRRCCRPSSAVESGGQGRHAPTASLHVGEDISRAEHWVGVWRREESEEFAAFGRVARRSSSGPQRRQARGYASARDRGGDAGPRPRWRRRWSAPGKAPGGCPRLFFRDTLYDVVV